jgi:hypothetical protein
MNVEKAFVRSGSFPLMTAPEEILKRIFRWRLKRNSIDRKQLNT